MDILIDKPNYLGGGQWKTEVSHKINIIFGKNGSGKSELLRRIASSIQNKSMVHLLSPERGGFLQQDANIETTMRNDPNWDIASRLNTNQVPNFKQRAIARWGLLLNQMAGRLTDEKTTKTESLRMIDVMKKMTKSLDELLPYVGVLSSDGILKFYNKENDEPILPKSLSSGESEVIAMTIECMQFVYSNRDSKEEFLLLLDEPDLHLHPELQKSIAEFLFDLSEKYPLLRIIIATHSFSMLASLSDKKNVGISWLSRSDTDIVFSASSKALKRLKQALGGHPLGIALQNQPILLVEGNDDERVWNKAKRSSQNKIDFYPIVCENRDSMKVYEKIINNIIASITNYNNKKTVLSLRDRDDDPNESIPDMNHIKRCKTSCREIENCFLSDECLALCGTSWPKVKKKIKSYLGTISTTHVAYSTLSSLVKNKNARKIESLKPVMTILRKAVAPSDPFWQDKVGQTIATWKPKRRKSDKYSISNFLGKKIMIEIKEKLKK